MPQGRLILLLHAHLPFVRHPGLERSVEETWLFEAISETYLPLLRVLGALEADKVPFRLVFALSPTLTAMLQDELLQTRYVAYAENALDLARREIQRNRHDEQMARLAKMYHDLHEQNLSDFIGRYERDITRGFDYHYKRGKVELLATAATHAYLPLYSLYPQSVHAQVGLGVGSHQRLFGKPARGFWLPECGYTPGLEDELKEHGIDYFFTATHGIVYASERPRYGVYQPVRCPNGVIALGADHLSTDAVWSAEDGYPSDHSYRDFYRDIGHDLPLDYIGPYLPDGSVRINTGFKYYAVTGRTDRKRPYDPDAARRKVVEHADNFIYNQLKRIRRLTPLMDESPVIVCPFDAELFGHWWFEGPQWIEALIRRIAQEEELHLTTPSELGRDPASFQTTQPAFSSWGTKGYSEVWLDGANDWIVRHTHKAIERICELTERFPNEGGLKRRALNQAAREVLLSQASDWPFIIRAGTAVTYAVNRVKEHVGAVGRIYEALGRGPVGTEWLTQTERAHSIFPEIDYRVFSGQRERSPFAASLPTVQ